MSDVKVIKEVSSEKTSLEGAYECPSCGGHMMLDSTYLDQVGLGVVCPYCRKPLAVTPINIGDVVAVIDNDDTEDFDGTVVGIKLENNSDVIFSVRDQEDNVFDIHSDRVYA